MTGSPARSRPPSVLPPQFRSVSVPPLTVSSQLASVGHVEGEAVGDRDGTNFAVVGVPVLKRYEFETGAAMASPRQSVCVWAMRHHANLPKLTNSSAFKSGSMKTTVMFSLSMGFRMAIFTENALRSRFTSRTGRLRSALSIPSGYSIFWLN